VGHKPRIYRSITTHPTWKTIAPFITLQVYGRDNGRIRIELKPMPPKILRRALRIIVACAGCGKPIRPIRKRRAPLRGEEVAEHMYYACTCPLPVNLSCSRSMGAKEEYLRVQRAL
jgi:hypothetical protein